MFPITLHTHLDAIEALKFIELLDTLRETIAHQYAEEIRTALQPCRHSEKPQPELPFERADPPF